MRKVLNSEEVAFAKKIFDAAISGEIKIINGPLIGLLIGVIGVAS